MTYPEGDISLALFMRILGQLPNNTAVVPFFRGESLLHPLFTTYMKYLRGFREVQFATNADYLTPENQHAILHACTFVSVSIHKYQLPSQTKLPSFFYDALGEGVETQVSILDSLLPSKKSQKRFVKEWCNHVDRVRIYKTHSTDGFGSMKGEEKPVVACNKPFEDMVIYWNGKVGLCNHDWNGGTLKGDLNLQTVHEVWNSASYNLVRNLHREGKRGMIKACEKCSFTPHQVYGELIGQPFKKGEVIDVRS